MQLMRVELGINGHTKAWEIGPEKFVTIGRHPSCDIAIDDPYISRRHAVIFFDKGEFRVHNLSRTNPVVLNEAFQVKHNQNACLNEGDTLDVGLTSLRVGNPVAVAAD